MAWFIRYFPKVPRSHLSDKSTISKHSNHLAMCHMVLILHNSSALFCIWSGEQEKEGEKSIPQQTSNLLLWVKKWLTMCFFEETYNGIRLPVCYWCHWFVEALSCLLSWDIFFCCGEIYIYMIGSRRDIIVVTWGFF